MRYNQEMEAIQPEYRSIAEYGLKVPQLLLFCGALRGKVTPLPEYGPWLHIEHEAGGSALRTHQFFGLLLEPKEPFGSALCELESRWRGSGVTPETVTLDEVLTYNDDVSRLLGGKIGCGRDHDKLEEGLYPIDCEVATLRRLTGAKWPRDLDELLYWGDASPIERLFGRLSRWELFPAWHQRVLRS